MVAKISTGNLLSKNEKSQKISVQMIRIKPENIIVGEKGNDKKLLYNARQTFIEESIESLAENIRINGLLNNPGIQKLATGENLLIFGERRLRAIKYLISKNAKCLDKQTGDMIPAKKLYGEGILVNFYENLTEKQAIRLHIAENIDTEKVPEFEMIRYCIQLEECRMWNRKEISEMLNRSQGWISQTISFSTLPERAVKLLQEGKINRTGAMSLLRIKDDKLESTLDHIEEQIAIAEGCVKVNSKEDLKKIESDLHLLNREEEVAKNLKDIKSLNDIAERRKALQEKLDITQAKTNSKPRVSQRMLNELIDGENCNRGKARPLSSKTIRDLLKSASDEVSPEFEGIQIPPEHWKIGIEILRLTLGSYRSLEEAIVASYGDNDDDDEPEEDEFSEFKTGKNAYN